MKILTASNGKKTIKMTKVEWQQIGKTAGWDPVKRMYTPEDTESTPESYLSENAAPYLSRDQVKGKVDSKLEELKASNINATPEELAEIVNGSNVRAACLAVSNMNCTEEIFNSVVEDYLNEEIYAHVVAYYAAGNPNLPSNLIERILSKGKADKVSIEAADNPNCTPEMKRNWQIKSKYNGTEI